MEEFSKLPIKKLRQFLKDRGIECKGCAEKSDFVTMAFENKDLPVEKKEFQPSEKPAEDKKDVDDVSIDVAD